MKKIILISSLFMLVGFHKADAQLRVNVNIGVQPLWGPVGYDYVDYYYLPDLDVYYDVPRRMFVYFNAGRWMFAASLPARYGRYDLYHSYKVVVNDRDPWLRNDYYRDHYRGYRGRYQPVIRDSHDDRYFGDRPSYDRDHRAPQREDRGDYRHDNGRGHSEDHGRGDDRGRGHRDRD